MRTLELEPGSGNFPSDIKSTGVSSDVLDSGFDYHHILVALMHRSKFANGICLGKRKTDMLINKEEEEEEEN
ncbi:hypothetical protein M0802_006714 [Mischocyttarus mexicanus]|nr:hypothetical protein M0802_006714 [Mischocyttarus mexicanus]